MQFAHWASIFLGLTFLVLIISALLKKGYKSFPLVLAYSVALLLSTVVVLASRGFQIAFSPVAERYYWVTELLLQSLLFAIVISLIYRSTSSSARKGLAGRWLVAGALAVTGISVVAHRQANLTAWMTSVSRDLNFLAAVLDLLLWSALISTRHPDKVLLAVSGGLGVQFAGNALGHSLRQLSRELVFTGNLVMLASNVFCLYVWWQAFRNTAGLKPAGADWPSLVAEDGSGVHPPGPAGWRPGGEQRYCEHQERDGAQGQKIVR